MAAAYNNTRDVNYRAILQYDKRTGKILGRTYGDTSGQYAKARIVITKIEVYS